MNTNRSEKKRVVLAGGSGFLGRALADRLERRGYEAVILTRDPRRYDGPGRPVEWDGETVDAGWVHELEGADAIVNLAGKNVNCRRSAKNERAIRDSRVRSTEVIGEALREVYRVPKTWVQASTLAIYGNAGDRICDETAYVPRGFPSDVCVEWEEALGRALRPEMRWSILRIGFVLGREGGALPSLSRLARLGFGGPIGSGRQWISWIHIEDMTRLFLEAIENPSVTGICNASGLQPVPNAEFMEVLRDTLAIPIGIPLPAEFLRGMAPIVGVDPDLALNGRRGLPVRIHGLGFRFRFHELDDALADLLGPRAEASEPAMIETYAR